MAAALLLWYHKKRSETEIWLTQGYNVIVYTHARSDMHSKYRNTIKMEVKNEALLNWSYKRI